MSLILVATPAGVKPVHALTAPPHVLAAYSRWAADQVLQAPASLPCSSPTADDGYVPTIREAFEEAGYSLGRAGVLTTPESAFPSATPRDLLAGGYEFTQGQHLGYSRFARDSGYDAALAGQDETLPDGMPKRFELHFLTGYSMGVEEGRNREEIMADHFQQMEVEAMDDERERELMTHNREAGGWFRSGHPA